MDISEINRRTIEKFRAGDEIEGMHRDRLLLLTTIGRHSGRSYTTPMMFHRVGGRLLVIASNVGAPKHPHWYLNLVEDPLVTVEVGDDIYSAQAVPLAGAEREQMWSTIKELYPFFADHERATERAIPVVALSKT